MKELQEKMKEAMRSKDTLALSTYRSMITALTNVEKSGKTVNEIEIFSTLAKQRQQSIEQFTNGGNLEMAEQEKAELEIIKTFLPSQMNDDELEQAIIELIDSINSELSIKDMGRVIGMFKSKYDGQDMSKVSKIIKNKLV